MNQTDAARLARLALRGLDEALLQAETWAGRTPLLLEAEAAAGDASAAAERGDFAEAAARAEAAWDALDGLQDESAGG